MFFSLLSSMKEVKKIIHSLQPRSLYTSSELQKIILPLTQKIITLHNPKKTIIIGIQGGQGTGKTTLVNLLSQILTNLNYKVKSFSIDNFYQTAKQRKQLAKINENNPFYQIPRGMPGTHRIKELKQTLNNIKAGKPFQIPLFDKSLHQGYGDILKKTIKVNIKQDFILFDGWCVGIPTTSTKALQQICKKDKIPLKEIDPKLKYHKIVLSNIKQYQPIWKNLNYLIMLKPDSSTLHQQWRSQQELELIKKKHKGMSQAQVEHFVNIYLPFTYLCYEKIKPNLKILINKKHEMYKIKEKLNFITNSNR